MVVKDMLNQIIGSIVAYLPNLIGALAILLAGWIVALIVSTVVRNVLQRTKLAGKISGAMGEEESKAQSAAQVIGRGLFWLIMALVLIAFFEALRLTMVIDPLEQLMNHIFQFLPRLLGAGILLLVAWITAAVSRLAITKVMGVAKFDERIGGRISDEETKRVPLTKTAGEYIG
ncbi:MAG: hypothetical protein KKC46_15310 [Proteobacteria bacterium]|nr:hypothetical protein [Pseudomonadota bacterium]